jgi:hypothetical protein
MHIRSMIPAVALVTSLAAVATAQTTTVPAAKAPTAVAAAPAAVAQASTGVATTVAPVAEPPEAATFDQAPPAPPSPPSPPLPPLPPAAAAPQAPPSPRAPQASTGVRAPRGTTGEAPAPEPFSRSRGQLINLRLEFTVTDQIGTAAPVKKTVMMNVADGESGRIRTNAEVPRNKAWTTVPLSVDAYPIIEGAKIRLRASLEYQLLSEAQGPDLPAGKTSMTQSVTALLNDGVSTILCQSADPLTDRKVTLEVKATIIK